MPTASEEDLIRRNLDLHRQLSAARAELSREAAAAAGLQDELRAARAAIRREVEARDEQARACNELGTALAERAAQVDDLTARLQDAAARWNELLGLQEEKRRLCKAMGVFQKIVEKVAIMADGHDDDFGILAFLASAGLHVEGLYPHRRAVWRDASPAAAGSVDLTPDPA
jgi:hypothetical protein